MTTRYQGDFIAWPGGCGLLGLGGGAPIDTHSHYAIQLVIGAPSGLKVRVGRQGDLQPCAAALIPSRAPHTIAIDDCRWSAVLFIEPETTEGKALTALLAGQPLFLETEAIHAGAQRLEQAWLVEQSAELAGAACMDLVRGLAQARAPEPTDARVLAVVAHIQRHVDQPVTLDEAAAIAGLSASRLRHLFVAETGMPLRTYVLWRRLLHVWTLLVQGETLAGAAHAAGFADSAHLSRTARTMFGLPPSAMQLTGPLTARRRAQIHG